MSMTILLPDDLKAQLQREAEAHHRSIEEIALGILSSALEPERTLATPEDMVAKIKATSSSPPDIRPAHGSLAAALRDASDDPDFDLAQWNREWLAVEAEMKGVTRANDLAEGRR